MSYFLLFFVIFGMTLILPANAQTTPLTSQSFFQQRIQLHEELRDAIKGKDKQKIDQLRQQLNSLHKQQITQIQQLHDQVQTAVKSGDKQKTQQLRKQLMDMLRPGLAGQQGNRFPGRRPWMDTDPQAATIHQELRDAVKSKDKQKADQLRQQLNSLLKQHFAQIQQLHQEEQAAIKSRDKPKAQQLREQLMATMP